MAYEFSGSCETFVSGSIYSRKGGGRLDDCTFPAKYRVTMRDGRAEGKCGVHVRRYRLFNESQWRTDDVLRRPRRPAWYKIEPFVLD